MASLVIRCRSSIGEETPSDAVVEEQLTLSRRTSTSSLHSRCNRTEAMAQQSAAVQQLTLGQLQKFHDQQEEMVQRFSLYLQEQFQNQL
ncbi:hypothetical protein GN958_ATG11240 [Phytophthora infestans]|uniref:Uncharacterized protein n=1 Tax=Phytophthora infestans TaxID=4787 RepID=A0A8S9UJN3_PHYIN|nr:hypothetical protein GN958_ATG11240 [Phytophthora infestans]